MKSFLQHIVDDADKNLLKDTCYVFPSRRACVYFNDLLQKRFADEVIWAPKVLSIEEFIQEHSRLVVVDEIRLILLLFEEYKNVFPEQSFDIFYAWGQTLLHDFDEIDRNLVDSQLLYKNLQEIKEVDESFGISEEALNALKSFQAVINTSGKGELVQSFRKTWELAGKVYQSFKKRLLNNKIAYNGLCYRQVAESLASGEYQMPYKQIVFAGFNALSKAEEQIIDHLLEKGVANVYLDADKFYLDNDYEEAGYFLRKLKKKWYKHNAVNWIISDGFSQPKNITISGATQNTAQAQIAGQHIERIKPGDSSVAIALADESLLMPVLYALPAQEENMNITMGYPVFNSSIGNMISSYFRYHSTLVVNASGNAFCSIESLRDLLIQPFVKEVIQEPIKLNSTRSRYLGWQTIKSIIDEQDNHKDLIRNIFSPKKDIADIISSLKSIILDLYLIRKDKESGKSILEERIIYSVVKYLDNLNASVSAIKTKLQIADISKLVSDSLKQLKAPFAGEPLAGLQIMGFLETRVLDFENLIILSVNEELLPASDSGLTYIPFGVRKAFQLPTFQEHSSIYAYHFYRLLQRAKKITLVYNTKLSITGGGEKSRFILQLLNRFSRNQGAINLEEEQLVSNLGYEVSLSDQFPIEKTGWVKERLKEHFASFNENKQLSPTALIDYISCSLKYFFARILKIREPEEIQTEIDARIFGNILHELLERAYKPWIGKQISEQDLKNIIKKDVNKLSDEVFSEYLGPSGPMNNDGKQYSGEIDFTKHVVETLAKKIVENDLQNAPFTIIDLESRSNPLSYTISLDNGMQLPIGGIIDRLDKISIGGQSMTRVLDYKTGKVILKSTTYNRKPITDEEYIQAHFNDPEFKAGFQLLYYALIYHKNSPEQSVNAGIIGAKSLAKGIEYLQGESKALSNEQLSLFEQSLRNVLNELLNLNVPFKQTDDIDRCEYCDFKSICSR
ncbi:MAG: PD-(D/E)XK nuclease family protein [Bacteroidota bacterium]